MARERERVASLGLAMNPLANAVLITWERNAGYGLRLLGGLEEGQLIAQPVVGRVMNHPAWIFSHLNLYAEIAVKLTRGEGFEDPAEHRYGQKSAPLADGSAYASRAEMEEAWTRWHAEGTAALRSASVALTSSLNPLERWRGVHPTVGDMLVTLMVKHEAGHLGQMSAWRRGMGLERVAV